MTALTPIRKRSGRVWWYATWKDAERRNHAHALGTQDRLVAQGLFLAACKRLGLEPGATGPGPSGGLQDARAAFLAHVRVGAPSPRTVAMVEAKLDRVLGAFGETPWTGWGPRAFTAWLDARGWAPRTVGMHVGVARRFVKWCREHGYPCPDFASGVKAPKVRRVRPKIHTPAQVAELLAAAEGHALEIPIHLACRGLSKGDIRTLDWSEVDLRARRILRERGREKTGAPLPVPLQGRLLAVLRAVPAKRRVGRVCPAIPLEPHSGNEDRALRIICRRAGVPECGWHRLRHSFASMLYAEGVGLPTIAEMLGHAPGSPMVLRYVQPDWKALQSAAKKAERMLGGAGR